MNTLTGTGALLRLALRLDRVRLPVWVFVLAALPAATAAQYAKLYPTDADLREVSGVISNPSLVGINGPLFRVSLGGLTAWKIIATELILIGLMSLLTVIRHTRTEEETGRLELVSAGVVGRYAALTAALCAAGVVSLITGGLVTLGLVGTGLPAAGAIALGLSVGALGLVFAAVAAVAAQLTANARSATMIGAGVLGAAYLLRAVGDTGPTWLSWLSPIGWGMRVRPFAGERWWVFLLAFAFVVLLAGVAYALAARRDVGAGVLAQRPGPAAAGAGLRGSFGLAWRLQRGALIGWLAGMALWGAALGGAANGISGLLTSNQRVIDMLARLGGRQSLVDTYLAAVFGITGLVAAVYTVQATLRLHAEENAGRVESLLATALGRTRWALSHLLFAVLGTGAILAVAGVGAGLAYGLQAHDVAAAVPRMVGAALVQLPAAWVFAGLGTALLGLAPRFSGLAWAGLVVCLVLLDLGAVLGLHRWLLDVSPFAHVPKMPGQAWTAEPLLWLTAVALALAAGGLAGLRRRDMR